MLSTKETIFQINILMSIRVFNFSRYWTSSNTVSLLFPYKYKYIAAIHLLLITHLNMGDLLSNVQCQKKSRIPTSWIHIMSFSFSPHSLLSKRLSLLIDTNEIWHFTNRSLTYMCQYITITYTCLNLCIILYTRIYNIQI